MGRTRGNRIVNAMGAEELLGTFQTARITGATANSLIGEILTGEFQADIYAEGKTA